MGNVSYEHHLNENSGIGAHASFVFSKHISSLLFYKSWYVLPYYRYYFGKRWARGFFIDGFTGLVGTKVDVYYSHQYSSFLHYEKNITKFNVGVSIGGKWDTKNNIIFETSLGIGTTFQEEFPLFTKGMLGIGYRF